MSIRRLGALLVLGAILGTVLAGPAAAVEAGEEPPGREPLPSINEVGSGTERAREFVEAGYEEPPFFRWFYWVLTAAGVLVVCMVLFRYLLWQPRFAEERKTRRRR